MIRVPTRWVALLALVVLVVAVPASAADRFQDVAGSNPHHDAVGRLVDAGITTGCQPGRYCPNGTVRRDQMASFLVRAAPRVGYATSTAPLTTGNQFRAETASVTARATGASGGRSIVTLHGTVTVYATGDVSSCPCEVEAFVFDGSDRQRQGPSSWGLLPAQGVTTDRGASVSVPVVWSTELPSGTSRSYRIGVFVNNGQPGGAAAQGTLTAITTPSMD